MRKSFTAIAVTLIVAAATVLCVYLTRFEFEFAQPQEHGEYRFQFKYRK